MGCDIHMVFEKKNDGAWVGVHDYPWLGYGVDILVNTETPPTYKSAHWRVESRDYSLFARIASVRGSTAQSRTPRGVPDDASDLTRMRIDEWGEDGHSHTWLTLYEFAEDWIATRQEGAFEEDAVQMLEGHTLHESVIYHLFGIWPGEESDRVEDYRLVIWFDN